MLTFVTATRYSRADFEVRSPLACSLKRVGELTPLRLLLVGNNSRPLAEIYNSAIQDSEGDEILVFVHDDVCIDDWMLGARLQEALLRFDVVGVAGNRRRQPGQETWYMKPGQMIDGQRRITERDGDWLSGAVRHGVNGERGVSVYGAAPAAVALLDGMFLAARGKILKERGVAFDPVFPFHFYDLDFCRVSLRAGLTLGTWPLAMTHESCGESVRSNDWAKACDAYFRKWYESEQAEAAKGTS